MSSQSEFNFSVRSNQSNILLTFQFTVSSYEKTQNTNEIIIFFHIQLKSFISNQSWEVLRSQFMINDYFTSLQRSNLLDNDPIPQLTLTNENYLKSYCAFLNDYLHKLCDKEHIINSPLTLKFFELEHHIYNSSPYHNKAICRRMNSQSLSSEGLFQFIFIIKHSPTETNLFCFS